MKQLAQTLVGGESQVIVGLHERAIVFGDGVKLFELVAPQSSEGSQEIQAVAVTKTKDGQVWYAVARYDKSLALYCPDQTTDTLHPVTIHRTAKRTSCLLFAHVPAASSNVLTVVIAGDLAGDATAFPLRVEPDSREASHKTQELNKDDEQEDDADDRKTGRLLLGHTASMLTGLVVAEDRVFTSDRDEKIRISSFPNTDIIQGYLLGHEAFVSCLDVNDKSQCVVSGSGDGTLRLWDIATCRELACLPVYEKDNEDNSLLPTKVLFNQTGDRVVAIYDESLFLDLFHVIRSDNRVSLSRSCRVKCETQPLALALLSEERILVVAREPIFVQVYQIKDTEKNGPSLQPCSDPWLDQVRDYALSRNIAMPASILERDKHGNLKMNKITDTRSTERTWNDASRKETARERNRRQRKAKRARQESVADDD